MINNSAINLFFSSVCLANNDTLSIVIGTTDVLDVGSQISHQAFRRSGIEIIFSELPGERALLNVSARIDDGDIGRIAGLEKVYPNLVCVPESMLEIDGGGYVPIFPEDYGCHKWQSRLAMKIFLEKITKKPLNPTQKDRAG